MVFRFTSPDRPTLRALSASSTDARPSQLFVWEIFAAWGLDWMSYRILPIVPTFRNTHALRGCRITMRILIPQYTWLKDSQLLPGSSIVGLTANRYVRSLPWRDRWAII